MPHARQQIRDAAATLITGLASTGTRVFKNRLHQLQQSDLPCWSVSTGDEDAEVINTTQDRTMLLQFDGFARGATGENAEDALSTMIEELEAVMVEDSMPLLKTLQLESVEIDYDAENTDQVIGSCTVTYRARYFTAEGAAGTAL